MFTRAETIVVEFDGVLHPSKVGQQYRATEIPNAPTPGALKWLEQMAIRYRIAIFSTRSHARGGILAMRDWLLQHGLDQGTMERLWFPMEKPSGFIYIDARGYRFTGSFPDRDDLEAHRVTWEDAADIEA